MKLCQFISSKGYDFTYIFFYALYVITIIACFIHEDIFVSNQEDLESDVTKTERI